MPLPANAQAVTPEEAQQIAEDAYIYGYSLITTEVTRVQMSNVPKVEGLTAPTGQFINIPRYPPADYRGVSAPNADTLYSLGWLDLTEPQVFSHPDMGNRFYLFEVTDLWMSDSESSPSRRTADGKAANYLFTGPGWKGEVPAGMKQFPMATRYMVILGRTYADGTEQDYKAVNELQAQYKITPLSSWGKSYTPVAPPVNPNPGFSMTDKPQPVIIAMGTEGYFNLLAKLMGGDAPPAAGDGPILASMAKIGIVPGKPFEMSKLDPAVQAALKDIPQSALKKIEDNKAALGGIIDGWVVTKGLGTYGPDSYMMRAVVAAFGWPANQQRDAVYPYTETDSTGQKLTGANKYTLTFAKDATPPVNGFWSITMYMIDQGWWFVPNPLNKFTVSLRDNPKFSADGSLTLYLQDESPGKDKEANWLPAPKGEFIPMLRMYWPKDESPSILNGSWKPPAVQKAS
ncbi:DUF1254 domain-containing protein [Bradyrhizobium rifense]|uniref:DUF1254 domain-containing protein n=3 Tax=Nitrobacteraceae TaxID=41294 RepID=A0A5D3KI49_9BRAD|nr:DUF1254 domain-containing protein [Bradyrhizobium cytisi]TYL96672.1 DUF1254 domain-containing protein [Bradyrhizobium rifense]